MDDQLVTLDGDEHNDLEQVGGTIRADDQPSVRVLADVIGKNRVFHRVSHVVIEDTMSTGG